MTLDTLIQLTLRWHTGVKKSPGMFNLNLGGGQPFEQPNVERPIFQNFEIPNIKRTKDELFYFFNFEFIFYLHICLNYLNTKNI